MILKFKIWICRVFSDLQQLSWYNCHLDTGYNTKTWLSIRASPLSKFLHNSINFLSFSRKAKPVQEYSDSFIKFYATEIQWINICMHDWQREVLVLAQIITYHFLHHKNNQCSTWVPFTNRRAISIMPQYIQSTNIITMDIPYPSPVYLLRKVQLLLVR